MRAGGLEERLRRRAFSGLLWLAASGACVVLFWVLLWRHQAVRVDAEAERYAEAEGLAAARALLYDLSVSPDAKRLHRLEILLLETSQSARNREPPPGLMEFVWSRLGLPDTALWEAAREKGLAVTLADVEAARAAAYREEIRLVSARLVEDLEARVSFSEHVRGLRLFSAGGAVRLQVGEAPPRPKRAAAGRVAVTGPHLVVTLPLTIQSRTWGEAQLVMDRGPLLRMKRRLNATLEATFAALLGLLLLLTVFLAGAWRMFWKTLRREVVEPVAELHRRMEAWARGSLVQEGPAHDEPARLREVFERMVQRIEQQQEELLRVRRLNLLERLGAALSHEMNNALNPAVLRVDGLLLEGRGASPEDLRTLKEYLEAARKVLRDFAHATRGEAGPERPLRPHEWLEPALELARPAAGGAGVHLEVAFSGGPVVLGDAQSLVQVALNLLLNAIDAAREGGGNVRVRFEESGEDRAALEVHDDGPGLSPEVKARLFEPFVTTKAQGTGLGLYVVDTLVRRMGGRVALRPREGGGTSAVVELRRAAEPGDKK